MFKKLLQTFAPIISISIILIFSSLIYQTHYKVHYTYKDLVWDGKTPISPLYITKKQAREDINLLIYALKKAYVTKDFIDQNLFNQVIKKFRKLPLKSTIHTRNFCQEIDKILLEIPDNHLHATMTRNVRDRSIVYCGFEKDRRALRKTRGVGNNQNNTNLPWLVKSIVYHNKNILLIAITRFPYPQSNEWKGFLSKVKDRLNEAEVIILDLRDNRGGNSSIANQLAKILYNSHQVPYPVKSMYFKNTPESYTIYRNSVKKWIKKSLAEKDNVIEMQNYDAELLQKVKMAKQKNSPLHIIKSIPFVKTPKNLVKKTIVILTNKHCGSSGETMVDLMEAHPHVVRIGENTAGAIHFVEVGFFILPHSRLHIQMPCKYKFYRDGRFIERRGIEPHLQVAAGKDAFDVALEMIAEKSTLQIAK